MTQSPFCNSDVIVVELKAFYSVRSFVASEQLVGVYKMLEEVIREEWIREEKGLCESDCTCLVTTEDAGCEWGNIGVVGV